MARPLRIDYPGAWYHVMNRGAGRRAIYRSDEQRAGFLALLSVITETFGVEVHAYCLMDNHYHLLVHTPRGGLARAMRHLNGVYTQRYNREQGTDGPLFRGRYKAILVDADSYLAQLSRYIHRNPTEAGVLKRPERYRWSSYRAYIGQRRAPSWLHLQPTLSLFGERTSRRRYQAFVEQGIEEELRGFYAKKRLDPVLGDASFRKRIARLLRKRGENNEEIPQRKQVLKQPTLNMIMAVTAKAFGVSLKALGEEGRGRGNLPRAVAMALARTPGGYSLAEIARAFGVGHYATVSVGARRLRVRLQHDPTLARRVRRLRAKLFEA